MTLWPYSSLGLSGGVTLTSGALDRVGELELDRGGELSGERDGRGPVEGIEGAA